MMLSDKYRPRHWAEIIGQDEAVAKLRRITTRPGWVGGVLLLTGPSGCGKTTAAKIIGDEANPEDPAATITIDSRGCTLERMREVEADMAYYPWAGHRKTYIIDEAQSMSKTAQEYALGMLERLPAHRIIVATSTESAPFESAALMSRWVRVRFAPLTKELITRHTATVAALEGIEIEPWRIQRLAEQAQGNMRSVLCELMAE